MKTFNLDGFKGLIMSEKNPFKNDIIDMEHGRMTIHRCNINKYLEKYACKNEEDLNDTLWYSYGCLVKVID